MKIINTRQLAKQAIESFNGHPEMSYDYAHRLLTKALSGNDDLSSEQRNSLRDDLEAEVVAQLLDFEPEEITTPEPPAIKEVQPIITDLEVERLVAEVFHTTITGEQEQIHYLSEVAREEMKALITKRKMSAADGLKVMTVFDRVLQENIDFLNL